MRRKGRDMKDLVSGLRWYGVQEMVSVLPSRILINLMDLDLGVSC